MGEISAEEFVEFAVFLHGDQWRNTLPAELGTSRKSLVLILASGERIPTKITNSLLTLIDRKLDQMRRDQDRMRGRVNALRGQTPQHANTSQTQPMDYLQRAC